MRALGSAAYLTRPLWDKPPKPHVVIPFLGFGSAKGECEKHGFRRSTRRPKVYDVFIFATELDLLEIRLNELDEVVDEFILIEAPFTFTGLAKPMHYRDNRDSPALRRFRSRIIAVAVPPPRSPLRTERDWFHYEMEHRLAAGDALRPRMALGDVFITSDIDEIPRPEVVRMLRDCAWGAAPPAAAREGWEQGRPTLQDGAVGPRLQLQLRQYRFSFEFPFGFYPRAAANLYYGQDVLYLGHHHSAATHALGDAGWHCTFCFRSLAEYQFKLRAYAHEDRSAPRHRTAEAIQRRICAGEDLGEMLPEAYTFKELARFADWGTPERSMSVVGLPQYVVRHRRRFRFLLPGAGNCIRELGSEALLSEGGGVDGGGTSSNTETVRFAPWPKLSPPDLEGTRRNAIQRWVRAANL